MHTSGVNSYTMRANRAPQHNNTSTQNNEASTQDINTSSEHGGSEFSFILYLENGTYRDHGRVIAVEKMLWDHSQRPGCYYESRSFAVGPEGFILSGTFRAPELDPFTRAYQASIEQRRELRKSIAELANQLRRLSLDG